MREMDNENEREDLERGKLQDIRGELQDLRGDVQDVKKTWEDDKPNATRKTKFTFHKHKTKLALLVALLIPAYFVLDPDIPEIPEVTWVLLVGVMFGCMVGYVPAKYVVDRFVKDTRKPLVEIDPEDHNDFALYYVPEERVPDIEVYEGEKNRLETTKGTGYEVEKFDQIEREGIEHLVAKGTWTGEKSGLELRRDYGNIEGMKKTLKPLAQKGFAYEVMWPHIMREMQSLVANQMARGFEGVSLFEGDSLRTEVEDLIEDYSPDNITNKVEEKDIDADTNGHSEDVNTEALERLLN